MAFSETVNKVFDTVKTNYQRIDLKKWSQDLGGSSAEAVHAAFYFLISFGTGFLLKKYCRHVISGLIIAIILIKFLEFNKVLVFDIAAFKTMTGVGSAADLNTVANNFVVWVKANIFLFGASIIGLLLGYKLG